MTFRSAFSLWTFSFLFFFSFSGFAQDLNIDFLEDVQCRSAVLNEIESMGATGEWAPHAFFGLDGSQRYLSPTFTLGLWVEAQVFLNKEVLLRKITSRYVETRIFDLESCEVSRKSQRNRHQYQNKNKRGVFTDRDLRNLVSSGVRGLIYFWSPNMPYSYLGYGPYKSSLEEIQALAQDLNLNLTVLLDPNASRSWAAQVVVQHDFMDSTYLTLAQAIEFDFRGSNIHYPSLLVYSQGRLARHVYPGRATYSEYNNYIEEILYDLEQ